MSIHLMKMCVAVASVDELISWISSQIGAQTSVPDREQIHTTRLVPKKIDDLLDKGSLYWVIKGNIQCRQKFKAIRPFTGQDGIRRCQLVLEPVVVLTHWQPRRPFQGWRYLLPNEAPADDVDTALANFPTALRQELASLGLL